jgi:hypothetical protein
MEVVMHANLKWSVGASFLALVLALFIIGLPTALSSNLRPSIATCDAWIDKFERGRTSDQVYQPQAQLICFDGLLEQGGADALYSAIRKAPRVGDLILVIRSGGGDAFATLPIGQAIVARHVTVVVHTGCGSACADYILLAATHRIIERNSVVLFHGGLSPHLIAMAGQQLRQAHASEEDVGREIARFRGARHIQTDLLRARNIDPDFIDWFDKIPTADWKRFCAPSNKYLVFSDRALAKWRVRIDQDDGLKTAKDVEALMVRHGAAHTACFWP